MLTKVTIHSRNLKVNLSLYVQEREKITDTLFEAYKLLASVAELSFHFDQAFYIVDGIRYGISSNCRAYKISSTD